MIKPLLKTAATVMTLAVLALPANAAEWAPSGPIKLMIAFRAGGGVDTQARMIAEELSSRHGWEIIPQNVAGKGGALMARDLVDEPNDGLTIGMTVSESLTYTPFAVRDPGYAMEDFTFLTTTAGTQMALFAKTDRGWKNLADVIAAAKDGEKLSVGTMSPRLGDATYLIGKANDIEFTAVSVKGGKGGLNGVVADDIDLAWGAGPQGKGVAAGDLVNLMSAEAEPLKISPGAPLLSEFGVPYTFGAKFMFIAPAGIPVEARDAISSAIIDVINDPETKVNGFINKAFGGVQAISGAELDVLMAQIGEGDQAMLQAASE